MCVSVVLKAHVCTSLSSYPLCVSLLHPLPWAPPHQPTYLLPSPSHLTTQQVEHWFRILLWPGIPCPDVSMVCSARLCCLPAYPRALLGWGA